jgi:flagellar biosynthesis/type III secretory pathway M-ring protein FliF/YscJ
VASNDESDRRHALDDCGQVAIWLAVIAGVVIIVREIARTIRARQETPLAIVQRRLANGEI